MAVQVREYPVVVTAGAGTAATPVSTPVDLPPGYVVTQVELAIPPGPRGEVGIALAVGGVQVLPFETGTYVVDDDDHVVWPLTDFPTSGAWSVLTYSTGSYDHTIRVIFLVTVPALAPTSPPPPSPIPTGTVVGTRPTPTPSPTPLPTPTLPTPTPGTPPPFPTPTPGTAVPGTLTLSVISSTALTVGTPAMVMVEAYSTALGQAPIVLTLAGTLPAGLMFATGGNGQATIAGTPTPTDLGTYQVTVTATQGQSAPVSATLTLSVSPPTPVGTYVTAPTSTVRRYGQISYYPTPTLADAVAALNAGQAVSFWTTVQTEPASILSAAQLLAIEHNGTPASTQYVTYTTSPVAPPSAGGTPPTPPTLLADWVLAPSSVVQTYAGTTYTPIATYAESLALAATPTTVYLWTRVNGIPSLQQTPASLAAWEHTGTHRYPQFTTYRRGA